MKSFQPRLILGVDAGGTKCEAVLMASDGTVLGWGRCDVSDPASKGSGRSLGAFWTSMRRAIRQAGNPEGRIVIVGVIKQHLNLPPELRYRARLIKVAEISQVLTFTPQRTGIVALAGTGALILGCKAANGTRRTLDGLGPVLGDYGGAYAIGIEAMRAVMRAKWHPRHATSLVKVVFAAARTIWGRSPRRLHWEFFRFCQRDRSEVASLARLVDIEARKGDRVAIAILRNAAEGMASVIFDLVDILKLERDRRHAFVGVGSVITRSDIFWEHLWRTVGAALPAWDIARLAIPPAVYLVLLTMRYYFGAASAMREERLFATLPRFIPGITAPLRYYRRDGYEIGSVNDSAGTIITLETT